MNVQSVTPPAVAANELACDGRGILQNLNGSEAEQGKLAAVALRSRGGLKLRVEAVGGLLRRNSVDESLVCFLISQQA